jgi:hypothetical protein
VANSRLNLLRALPDHAAEPPAQTAIKRYVTHVGNAIQNLTQLHAGLSSGQRPTLDPKPDPKDAPCH